MHVYNIIWTPSENSVTSSRFLFGRYLYRRRNNELILIGKKWRTTELITPFAIHLTHELIICRYKVQYIPILEWTLNFIMERNYLHYRFSNCIFEDSNLFNLLTTLSNFASLKMSFRRCRPDADVTTTPTQFRSLSEVSDSRWASRL